eukprot:5202280-Pyramimonas_sp.AAC.1
MASTSHSAKVSGVMPSSRAAVSLAFQALKSIMPVSAQGQLAPPLALGELASVVFFTSEWLPKGRQPS